MDYSPQGHKELDTTEGLTLLLLLEAKSNPGLLHCRQILYQLSYQESPFTTESPWKLLRADVL